MFDCQIYLKNRLIDFWFIFLVFLEIIVSVLISDS